MADLDVPSGGGRALVVATSMAAVMLAAVMVVALAPPKSNAPSAISATTLPALTVQMRSPSVQSGDATARGPETVRIGRTMVSRDDALPLVGSPNAISAGPSNTDVLDIADHEPENGDRIYVLTPSHTFGIRWSQIERIEAPDGSVVVDANGALLATFVSGELRVLLD